MHESCDVINDVKLFPTVSQDILSKIVDVIQLDVALQHKCIRIANNLFVCLKFYASVN